jgi:hypothetical protein
VKFSCLLTCLFSCGSGIFIPDPNFFHQGSGVRRKAPGPGSWNWIRNKELKHFCTQIIVTKLFKYDPGCSLRISDPNFSHPASWTRINGVQKHWIPDPDLQHLLVQRRKIIPYILLTLMIVVVQDA